MCDVLTFSNSCSFQWRVKCDSLFLLNHFEMTEMFSEVIVMFEWVYSTEKIRLNWIFDLLKKELDIIKKHFYCKLVLLEE
jgi:hypothetical protein